MNSAVKWINWRFFHSLVLPSGHFTLFALKTAYPFLQKLLLGSTSRFHFAVLLSLLEYLVLGIKLSAVLVIAILAYPSRSSAGFYHPGSPTRLSTAFRKSHDKTTYHLKRNSAYFALIPSNNRFGRSATLTAFNFFEFDPIYYDHGLTCRKRAIQRRQPKCIIRKPACSAHFRFCTILPARGF